MVKIYVDTNIFMDYWLDRGGRTIPFGLCAKTMFEDLVKCKYFLVISDYVIAELDENLTFFKDVKGFFEELALLNKIEIVAIRPDTLIKARLLAKNRNVPVHDAVHAIVAESKNAILITRDKHFQNLKDKITVLTPEELSP